MLFLFFLSCPPLSGHLHDFEVEDSPRFSSIPPNIPSQDIPLILSTLFVNFHLNSFNLFHNIIFYFIAFVYFLPLCIIEKKNAQEVVKGDYVSKIETKSN